MSFYVGPAWSLSILRKHYYKSSDSVSLRDFYRDCTVQSGSSEYSVSQTRAASSNESYSQDRTLTGKIICRSRRLGKPVLGRGDSGIN